MKKIKLNTFEDKLRSKTRRIVFVRAFYGFMMAFLSVAGLLYALFILAYFAPQVMRFHIPAGFLIPLMLIVPLLSGLIAGYLERRDVHKLTLKLEKQYPQLGDRLLTMVEIAGKREHIDRDPFSRMLARTLEADMSRLIDRFDFSSAASAKKLLIPAVVLAVCLGAGTVQALVYPDFFTTSFKRLTQAQPVLRSLPFFRVHGLEIKIIPGDAEIARGSNLMVQALVSGRKIKEAELHLKKANESVWQAIPMEVLHPGEFQTLLTNLTQACTYFVKIDGQESPVFQIKIIEAVRMERVMWNIQYPSYMKAQPQTRQGWGGKMAVPAGTKLHLEIGINQNVKPGWILENEKKFSALKIKTPKVLEADFEAVQDLTLTLDIQNESGAAALEVPSMWIQILPDLPPYVEILEPQLHNYVFPTQEIPFEISANDDYGLRAVTLVIHYQGRESRIEWLPEGKTPDSIVLKPVLRLETFKLNPRDLVFAYLEVRDTYPGNDPSHAVKSPLFAFMIRDYTEQYKINLPQSQTLSVRQYFEDIISEQEKIMQDTWEYVSQPPKETPRGWEMEPEAEKKTKT